MPKSAVVNLFFEEIAEEMSFKRLSLFFDKIYINEWSFRMWGIDAGWPDKIGETGKIKSYVQEIEWLIAKDIIKTYSFEDGEYK